MGCWSTCNVVPHYRRCCKPSDDQCNNAPSGFTFIKTGETGITEGCSTIIPGNTRDECKLISKPSTAACSSHPACSKLKGNCCPTDDGVILDCCSSALTKS